MTVAVRMPSRLPALVLLAALSAPAAWAGDAPVAPFPGTSVSDADVDGWQEGVPEQAPEPSEEAAPEAEAKAPGVAVPAVDAGPSDAAVPAGDMASEKPATPAGGSRLLRALADLPKTLGRARSDVPGDVTRPGIPRVFADEGCPRALLRRLLAGAAGEAGALSALGIEREILTLCRERQQIVAGLFETEARLNELRQAGRGPEPGAAASAASAVPAPRVEAAGEAPAIARAAASPLRAALGGAAEKANEADTPAGDTRAGGPQGGEPRGTEPRTPARVFPSRVSPRYAWFSIIGTAGALRAGISDGTGVWFVREGDALPGGATIADIAGRPPAVRVTGAGESGEATLLPFRARPGGSP